jgi:hypothetical protein
LFLGIEKAIAMKKCYRRQLIGSLQAWLLSLLLQSASDFVVMQGQVRLPLLSLMDANPHRLCFW